MPGPPAQHRGTVYGDDENLLTYLLICTGFVQWLTPPPGGPRPSAERARRALAEHYGNAAADTGCVHW